MTEVSGNVSISKAEYESLLAAERELAALEAAGVDNWIGYEAAMRSLEQ